MKFRYTACKTRPKLPFFAASGKTSTVKSVMV